MQIEIVRIIAPVSVGNSLGYVVINKADLTDGQVLFVEPAALVTTKPAKTAKSA